MINLIFLFLGLGFIVAFHELGHFLMARFFGVRIETFSIGFGRPIYQYERNGTNYCISWIPLGGYVKMHGENPDDEIDDPETAFQTKAWWKRMAIAFAGPFANLLLALLLFFVAYALPYKAEDQKPVVYAAPAISSTIFSPGDSILSVNGTSVKGWNQALSLLSRKQDNTITLYRQGKPISVPVQPSIIDSLILNVRPMVSNIIGSVNPNSPAWKADLRDQDIVLSVDSIAVSNWYEMRELIINTPRDSVNLLIQRNNVQLTKSITLQENLLSKGERIIGVSQAFPIQYAQQNSLIEAARGSFYGVSNFTVLNYYALYKLVQKPEQLKSNLGGPVAIASLANQAGRKGVGAMIIFLGSINLLLMIMNLLPIPILDGGHIFFCLIEGIRRKPLPLRTQIFLQKLGFTLLLILMAYAFYADISSFLLRSFTNH